MADAAVTVENDCAGSLMSKPVALEATLEAIGEILCGSEGGFAARSGPESVDTVATPDRRTSPLMLTFTETATWFGFVTLTTMCVPFDAAELVRLNGCLTCPEKTPEISMIIEQLVVL